MHIREQQILAKKLILKSSSDLCLCVGPWHTIQKAITDASWFCSDWCGKLPGLTVFRSMVLWALTFVCWVNLKYLCLSRVESYRIFSFGPHYTCIEKVKNTVHLFSSGLFGCTNWCMPLAINKISHSSWHRLGICSYQQRSSDALGIEM